MSDVVRFGVSLDGQLLEGFDKILEEKGYSNRSEALRDLIRNYIVENEWSEGNQEVVGIVTVVYTHEIRGIADKLTDLQHAYHGKIISSMHVHLDEHNCLEVLVVRGKADEVQKVAESLISTRGVKHGKMIMSTTGKGIK